MNVTLKGVRCSFPNLFKPKAFEDGGKAKYGMTALIDKKKYAKELMQLKNSIKEVVSAHFGGKIPAGVKVCLRDGSEKPDIDGYGEDVMFVSMSSDKRPQVVDRDLTPLAEGDEKPYAGCYVNVSFRLWVQDNKFGKRVNAQIRAVQFFKDGDPFGEAPVKVEEVFESLDGDEPDDDTETSSLFD